MGQQFTYDEKGSTFLYFLVSVFVMLLIPLSYFFWPKSCKNEERRMNHLCRIHGQSKWYKKVQKALQKKKSKPSLKKVGILLGWVFFFFLIYKLSNIENDHVEYNPYEVLGISEGATPAQIKKRYRELSREKHPDKQGGNQEEFIKISKAHDALVDPETRENWKKYGNPDGAQAMQFGIALPKWIFESNNSYIVLGIYVLLFMLLLPYMVGKWWYRSIKYSKEEVLLNTTQLFFFFINKSPNMNLKRAMMVFSAAFEFCHENNPKVRAPTPQDNEDLPELLRMLETNYNIAENAKERPMNHAYSIKARILINCHLARVDLYSAHLLEDLDYILTKSSILLQEMVNCISQLTIMANYSKGQKPRLETLENVMKLAPMMVQAIRESKSPLLQLPYFNEDYVKYCHTNKKTSGVKNLRALASMSEGDRRQMLRRMSDEAYEMMLSVLRNFPDIHLEPMIHVIDDYETHIITAGAIVTVTLHMTRKNLMESELVKESIFDEEFVDGDENVDGDGEKSLVQQKLKPWEKQLKKKKKKKMNKGSGGGTGKKIKKVEKVKSEVDKKVEKSKNSDSEEVDSETEVEDLAHHSDDDQEEREWEELQASYKKKERTAFEYIDKRTHTVYAPYYPVEKNEWWWVYVADRKTHTLLTAPVLICNLRDEQQVELKFPAPPKPGKYTYTIWCRSDSYLDCDRSKDIKLDVKEAKPVDEDHPQWQMSDDEDEDEALISDEEGISSDDESSDDR